VEFEGEPSAKEEDIHLVTLVFGFPFFFGDFRRFCFGLVAIDIIEYTGGIIHRAAKSRFVAVALQQLNRQHGHGNILGREGYDALGIFGRAGGVPQLKGGLNECPIDLRALARLRIFPQKFLEVADERGAIIAGAVDGLLQLLAFGGHFRGGRRLRSRGFCPVLWFGLNFALLCPGGMGSQTRREARK
jgi:hypothetical protein